MHHWLLVGLAQGLLLCCAPQVDQHVDALTLVCRGQDDVFIAGQLARKALQPQRLTLVGSDTDSSSASTKALLATGQHHPMFQRVQHLMFNGSLPRGMPQVSEELPA
jgi:D-alanyl-D-alanine carboxypeptidase